LSLSVIMFKLHYVQANIRLGCYSSTYLYRCNIILEY
jgi:hypothetical protein